MSGKKYVTMKALQEMLDGRSRTSIYEDVERGDLPQPIKLGGTLYWIASEVEERLEALRRNAA